MAQQFAYSIELPNEDNLIMVPCQTTAMNNPKQGMLCIDENKNLKIANDTVGYDSGDTGVKWRDPRLEKLKVFQEDNRTWESDCKSKYSAMIGVTDGAVGGFPDTQYLAVSGPIDANTGDYGVGWGSMALGAGAQARANGSLSAGRRTITQGAYSVAHGNSTTTDVAYQLSIGTFNNPITNSLFVIGNGSLNTKSNAFYVTKTGEAYANGTKLTGADYAEMFEWWDENPNKEDRVGHLVTLNGTKISFCGAHNAPLGIISGYASVVGDSAGLDWAKKYLTDDFGRVIYDYEEEIIEMYNPITESIDTIPNGIAAKPRINPDYNPEEQYIPRAERPEWATVGLLGKIHARDDGTCVPGGYGKPADGGILTHSDEPTQFYIMERTGDNIVLVFLK